MFKQYISRCSALLAATAAVLAATPASAVDLSLSQSPLFLAPAVPPLNMLVVGRDHKLYYEAYNDASDLNGDNRLDVGYKGYLSNPTRENPTAGGIDYYGYFDSYKCYTYADNLFTPARETTDKRCGGANEWSGDYLNYLTTARIDALRKVLYGGKRDVDTATSTVLVRTHIPMDAHSWGKEVSTDEPFNIRDYTPYDPPTGDGIRHLFANTTPNSDTSQNPWFNNNGQPQLRVILNTTARIWEWVSKESPVAGTSVKPPTGNADHQTITINDDYTVRVAVCVSQALLGREKCQRYPNGNYKPVGLLHEFGENNSMLFGLLTGSYTANKSGGVLRKNVGTITDEINSRNGTLTETVGIIRTLDRLRIAAYTRYTNNGGGGGTSYDCGLPAMAQGAPVDGTCRMWGNPVAEMMYETLRYFRGMDPTPAFTAVYGGSNKDVETLLGLPRPDWSDPYGNNRPMCARPFETVMADINNSYDSDQLPGSSFTLETGSNATENDLPNLNVSTVAQTITAGEPDVVGERFIGQSGNDSDGAPTAKTVTSLANIRGLAPEEPTKQGSYYPASVAYHGRTEDISTTADGEQNVQTFAVALASPLPKIEIPVAEGQKVTLVPFAKSVRYRQNTGTNERPNWVDRINRNQGQFQPTNQIVDFYVEALSEDNKSGTIQVNFEDVEAGNDHDMDAIVRYSYRVTNDGQVEVNVSSDYEGGGVIHHIGYAISGTTADGVYLVVQDCNRDASKGYICNGNLDWDYFLDTPPNYGPGERPFDNVGLPGSSSRLFSPASTAAATVLKDPLWYAAKWGGFTDTDRNDRPNLTTEWSTDGGKTPSNYFLVTNALKLSQQLRDAFADILDRSAAASSASVNSGSISTDTRIYQAKFNTRDWTGELFAYGVNPQNGRLQTTPLWNAAQKLATVDQNDREIITVNSDGTPVPFRFDNLDDDRKLELAPSEAVQQQYIRYLRGENVAGLRPRSFKLGDIVASAPIYVGAPRARYSDSMPGTTPYSAFVRDQRDRNAMLYVGANDGMLHGFDAGGLVADGPDEGSEPDEDSNGGREVFAFIPKTVFPNLKYLPTPAYANSHKYFVDGSPNSNDVFFNNAWHTVLVGGLNLGGQGVYALDVTDPARLANAEDNTNPRSIRLWEFTDEQDEDLGFTYSTPAIVRLQDGSWAAVFGNGYNNTAPDDNVSTTGNAALYIVNIADGRLIKKFDTGVGNTDRRAGGKPNGMATPVMVDIDGDRIVDHAYAGDLLGNLWKFDLRSTNNGEWDFAFRNADGQPEPLFIATDSNDDGGNVQPITVRPEVARGPYGAGVMVLFGTGKFLETTDKDVPASPPKQSFYGLVDDNTYTANDKILRRNLVQQTITAETTGTRPTRTTSQTTMNGNGFYLDLAYNDTAKGERAVTDPLVRGDRVIFTTLIPNKQQCDFGGTSWLMVLDLLSGARLQDAQLDSDGDGDVDGDDSNISGVGTNNEILSRPESLMCLTAECGDDDRLLSSGSSGKLSEEALRSIGGIWGRQSWRQIR